MSIAALALSATGCCVRLEKLVAKGLPKERSAALAAARPSYAVEVERAVWRDEKRGRDVPVTIWSPVEPPPTSAAGRSATESVAAPRKPVIVYSHGIGEDRDTYAWLGNALASEGFLAVHVTHAGTDKATLERGYRHLYKATKEKANWVARPLDISFVLDRIAERPDADMQRVAIAGHSAGAFTAFMLAGMRTADGGMQRDPRVRAIVAMSMPKMGDVITRTGYDEIRIPVLNITGTCDTSLIYRTYPRDRRAPFEWTRGHQTLVTIERANHDTFSKAADPLHPLLAQMTAAFLRAHLLGDASARVWFEESGLGEVSGVRVAVEAK